MVYDNNVMCFGSRERGQAGPPFCVPVNLSLCPAGLIIVIVTIVDHLIHNDLMTRYFRPWEAGPTGAETEAQRRLFGLSHSAYFQEAPPP
jgi:hypothetical protein